MRNQIDSSVISIYKSSVAFPLTFRKFQLVEHRLERLSSESRDGAASSLIGLHSINFVDKCTSCGRIHKSLVELAGSHFILMR